MLELLDSILNESLDFTHISQDRALVKDLHERCLPVALQVSFGVPNLWSCVTQTHFGISATSATVLNLWHKPRNNNKNNVINSFAIH
jgi:hypothetical protein